MGEKHVKGMLVAFGLTLIAAYGHGMALALGFEGIAGYLSAIGYGALLGAFCVPMLDPAFHNG